MGLLAKTLGHDILTVIEPGATDAHGDPAGVETRTILRGCLVQPAGSSEARDGRDTVTTRKRVFAPAQAVISATSRVEWCDVIWDVDADPESWDDPAGHPHHLEFVIVRTTG